MQIAPMNGQAAPAGGAGGTAQPEPPRSSSPSVGFNIMLVASMMIAAGLLLMQAKDRTMLFVGRVLFALGLPIMIIYLVLRMSA